MRANKRVLATLLLVVGVLSLVMGGVFVAQGFSKSAMITQAMRAQKVSYAGADGKINGIIDTATEAQTMAGILEQHRAEQFGYYSELKRDDPNRDQILKAMTMENALNLAVMGYGLTDVVKAVGLFMGLIGLTFVASGVILTRPGKIELH